MTVESASVHSQLVMRDTVKTWRWYDAFGPNVAKWEEDGVQYNVDDYTKTDVGTDTIALVAGADNGNLLFTSGTNENDGTQIQLEGEAFKFASAYPCYFGAKFKVNDADQVDVALGLGITDSTFIAGATDGLYFRSVDESAVLNFIAEKDENESSLAVTTLVDDTFVTVEFYYDGTSAVTVYLDGTEVGSIATSDTNFPDDEYLTPTLAILTGDASANTMTVEWARAIQLWA